MSSSRGVKRPTPTSALPPPHRSLPPSARARTPTASLARATTRTPTASLARAITRTATRTRTGTRTATLHTARQEDAYIVAIIDNSYKEVGLCAYNLKGFDVELRQFTDSNTFSVLLTALCVFAPVEILLSVSSVDALLDQSIRACAYLSHVKRIFVGRTYFNETYGAMYADKLSNVKCANLRNLGESSYYLALACCGALIRYVEHTHDFSFSPSSLRIRYRPNNGAVFLDMATLEGLEVVSNARQSVGVGGKMASACLLSVMDKTKTRAGKRFLRRSLLEPCADMVTITTRQDTVEELSNSEETYFSIVSALSGFPDLESATASLMASKHARLRLLVQTDQRQQSSYSAGSAGTLSSDEGHRPSTFERRMSGMASPPSPTLIYNVLVIKAALQCVRPLLEAIQGCRSPLLKALAESMRNAAFPVLMKEIDEVVNEDALPAKETEKMQMQGVFAVRSERNGRLDIARKTYTENLEDMASVREETQQKYGLQKLQLCLHATRGYHFVIPRNSLDVKNFPPEFIQVDEGKKMHRFSVEELIKLNSRYFDSLHEVWRLTEIELGSLLNEIFRVEAITALHRLCDTVAILDMLTSFVTYASESQGPTERPRLTENGPIALQKAYHPTLLSIDPHGAVPNDIFLDETSALHIISGRNQAGKSTFIRMVGLVTVMAHTGCVVPAKFATVRIFKRIVSRFSTGDDITQNQSHFSREMSDLAVIINSIRDNSSGDKGSGQKAVTKVKAHSTLVLIDELGRSTSTLDGFAIAYSVAEYLAKSPFVLTLFTTHFLGLGALAKVNPVVKVFQLKAETQSSTQNDPNLEEPPKSVKFTYTVESGILTDASYGIETARLAGCPQRVTNEAEELRSQLPVRRIANASDFEQTYFHITPKQTQAIQKMTTAVSVAQRMSVIRSSTTDYEKIRRMFHELQNKLKSTQRRDRNSERNPSRCGTFDISGTETRPEHPPNNSTQQK